MYKVELTKPEDFDDWLQLAHEVEPLFGPMVDVPKFQEGLKVAIEREQALCCKSAVPDGIGFMGGIVISSESNQIVWLAVREECRGKGIGDILLSSALVQLDVGKDVTVTTFAPDEAAGRAARKLYDKFGFQVVSDGPVNPAGVPTVVMVRKAGQGF